MAATEFVLTSDQIRQCLELREGLLGLAAVYAPFNASFYPKTWRMYRLIDLVDAGLLVNKAGDYELADPLPEWAELQLVQYQLGEGM